MQSRGIAGRSGLVRDRHDSRMRTCARAHGAGANPHHRGVPVRRARDPRAQEYWPHACSILAMKDKVVIGPGRDRDHPRRRHGRVLRIRRRGDARGAHRGTRGALSRDRLAARSHARLCPQPPATVRSAGSTALRTKASSSARSADTGASCRSFRRWPSTAASKRTTGFPLGTLHRSSSAMHRRLPAQERHDRRWACAPSSIRASSRRARSTSRTTDDLVTVMISIDGSEGGSSTRHFPSPSRWCAGTTADHRRQRHDAEREALIARQPGARDCRAQLQRLRHRAGGARVRPMAGCNRAASGDSRRARRLRRGGGAATIICRLTRREYNPALLGRAQGADSMRSPRCLSTSGR